MELWAGVECTVNRVGDGWGSQLALNGHDRRSGDLQLIADLGTRAIRYPVLWERTAPTKGAAADFTWAGERLDEIRRLGITPIVGLLHHGSGPAFTHLLDDQFASGLAAYALQVAERFPWVRYFSPVNEPLTTARFSALYGHWYPHRRDDVSFARALVNQCQAISMSMQAIRIVSPKAALVQTEDLGTTYSTRHMQYQCDFDNERRWLTWDLLCGRVDSHHPMFSFLRRNGISRQELQWFCESPCPPQIIGINHYVTSDRFLDERVGRYAPGVRGQNAKEAYADIEAVRIPHDTYRGWRVLEETWRRYDIPLALTEVHLGCTREEQLRWFAGAWNAAVAAREAGCDIKGVTAWSIFGSHNWNSLLTRDTGYYEAGAFDIRSPAPRPTALARLLRELSSTGDPTHPSVAARGWWEQAPDAVSADPGKRRRRMGVGASADPLVLIVASDTPLGGGFVRGCEQRNLSTLALSRCDLDVSDDVAVERILRHVRPWAIINAFEGMSVDEAEVHAAESYREHVIGPRVLVDFARRRQVPLLSISSDLVFGAMPGLPLVESSAISPVSAYGRSKAAMEQVVLAYERTLCVRTAAVFGAQSRDDFLSTALRALERGETFAVPNDLTVSPTYLPDLVSASLDLLIDGCTGLVHLASCGAISWAEFVSRGAAAAQITAGKLLPAPASSCGWSAPRPAYSVLDSERLHIMPSIDDALSRFAGCWIQDINYRREAVGL